MSDFEDQDDDMSLEDLDESVDSGSTSVVSDDWGDSYDDMDAESWDKEYRGDDGEELEDDPWALS